ncbi:MAG TPA: SIS domain-containing protein [Terracidiphilus sp.]|jgi:6-phospho-3-hexuloisomerase|nr:SIS domain-containing protein [Terracidiphilus sp.]
MATQARTFHEMAHTAISEIDSVLARTAVDAAEQMCAEILKARRIACYGVGREGLMMKALCMRLMHLGLDAHFVGDMTTPPLGGGDLLMESAGPGAFSTVLALQEIAHRAGARVLIITAQPAGEAPQKADIVIELPAQTMADDRSARTSLLPMGSLYEAAQLVFFDLVSILLREKTGQSPEQMRQRHTNLE